MASIIGIILLCSCRKEYPGMPVKYHVLAFKVSFGKFSKQFYGKNLFHLQLSQPVKHYAAVHLQHVQLSSKDLVLSRSLNFSYAFPGFEHGRIFRRCCGQFRLISLLRLPPEAAVRNDLRAGQRPQLSLRLSIEDHGAHLSGSQLLGG